MSNLGVALDAVIPVRPYAVKALVAGTIYLEDSKGNSSGPIPVAAGEVLAMSAAKVLATGTTLTTAQILLLY